MFKHVNLLSALWRFFFALILISIPFNSAFAEKEIEYLKKKLAKSAADTNKVLTLLDLSMAFSNKYPDESFRLAKEALNLSSRLGFTKGMALSEKSLGMYYCNNGDYVQTLMHWNTSLSIFDSIGDSQSMANILGNIGSVYFLQGDVVTALEYDLKTLKIAEKLQDTLRIVTCYINVAVVYLQKKATYPKALEFLSKALPLSKNMDDETIGTINVNLGEVYFGMDQLDTALVYLNRATEAHKNSKDLPYALIMLGKVYSRIGDFDKALTYQSKALNYSLQLNSQSDIALSLINMANSYLEIGNTTKALECFKKAEGITHSIGSSYQLKDSYEGLARTYAQMSDYKLAYEYQELLIGIKDTLFNLDIEKKLGTLQFTFDIEKKESQINLLTKDQEIKAQEIKRQKLVRNGFIGGFAVVLLFAGVFFSQRNRISKEKKRSDELLLNILPEETAEELKATGSAKAKSFDSVTVMFTDFKNFTQASEILTAEELVAEINRCYSAFDSIITRHGLEKIKTIGDSYMCAGGLPVPNQTHPVDMVNASLEILSFIEENKRKRMTAGLPYFELRLGIHTGPVVAGVVGSKKFAYDIWGDTVNTASRMESSGEIGRANISESTYDLVKDRFNCISRGYVQAKNKGEIAMYFVEGKKG